MDDNRVLGISNRTLVLIAAIGFFVLVVLGLLAGESFLNALLIAVAFVCGLLLFRFIAFLFASQYVRDRMKEVIGLVLVGILVLLVLASPICSSYEPPNYLPPQPSPQNWYSCGSFIINMLKSLSPVG